MIFKVCFRMTAWFMVMNEEANGINPYYPRYV